MNVQLTRRYRFSASHRLHTAALSEQENTAIFGKCNNPYGHGHDYELEVSLRGDVDPGTGTLIHIGQLDAYVQRKIVRRFHNRNINLDVPEFHNLVPTTENLTAVAARLLSAEWREVWGDRGPRLVRVHVQETPRNSFEWLAAGERTADCAHGSEPEEEHLAPANARLGWSTVTTGKQI